MNFRVFCNGSGCGEDIGACAFVITNEAKDVMLGSGLETIKGTSSQRMELEAAVRAFKHLKNKLDYGKGDTAIFYSDSKYLIDCYQKKWYVMWLKNKWKTARKSPVQNKDLWEQLVSIFERDDITFEYVPAQQKDTFFQAELWWNNYVSRLVQLTCRKLKKQETEV